MTAFQATLWLSDSSITSRAAPGTGSLLNLVITAAMQVKTQFGILSYDTPQLLGVSGRTNVPATGGAMLYVTGKNFGTFPTSARMRTGATACEATIWLSDSSIGCRVAAFANAGFEGVITTTVSGVTGTLQGAFTYDGAA